MESEKAQHAVAPIVSPHSDSIPDSPLENTHHNGSTEEITKLVGSAALSSATAAQKPSLFTKRMFLVRTRRISIPFHD